MRAESSVIDTAIAMHPCCFAMLLCYIVKVQAALSPLAAAQSL